MYNFLLFLLLLLPHRQVDETFPPRFTKLLVEFEDGLRLAFADPRRLGRICLRNDPLNTSPIKDLAADALLAPPSMAAFTAALQPVTCAVKALLLDQNRVVSGVGNWIADEVCYQARVHPAAPCNTLSDAQLASLHASLVEVVKTAVGCCATTSSFPSSYLFHHRWSKGKKGSSSKGPQDADGGAITFETVGGRTSAVVLSRQFKGQRIVVASASSKVEPNSNNNICTSCLAIMSAKNKVLVCKKCQLAVKNSKGAEVLSTEGVLSKPDALAVPVTKTLPRIAARSRVEVQKESPEPVIEEQSKKKKGNAKSESRPTIKKESVEKKTTAVCESATKKRRAENEVKSEMKSRAGKSDEKPAKTRRIAKS